MRLLSIDITNFRVIRHARFQFSDSLTGIIGPNGAGKSSLIEAVAWSLYGNRVARSGKDEIKATFAPADENCEVALGFDIAGEHYRIVRRLVGRSERAEVELYCGDRSESVGSIETLNHVTSLLGLDWRGFLSSFLARQQELNALADLPPGQRREHLAGMLGIERLDKALQRVKEDGKLYQRSAEMVGQQVQEKEALSLRLKQLGEQANSLTEQRDSTAGAYRKERAEFTVREAAFTEHQKNQAACSRLETELKGAVEAGEHQERSLASLKSKAVDLDKAAEELTALEAALVGFEDIKKELETATRVRQQAAHRADLIAQQEQFGREVKKLEADLAGAGREADEIKAGLKGIPEKAAELHRESAVKLEAAREDYSQARSSLKVADADIQKVEAQIRSMEKIGPEAVCDRCHRRFGSDLPGIREHLQKELAALVTGREAVEFNLETLKAKGESLKKQTVELEAQSRRQYELSVKLKALQSRQEELAKRRDDLKQQSDKLTGQIAKLGEAEVDAKRFETLKQQVAELEKKQSKAQQLRGRLADRAGLDKEIAEAAERLSKLKAEAARLTKQRDDLGFDEAAFQRAQAEFNRSRESLDRTKDEAVKAATALEVVLKEQEVLEKQLVRLEKVAEELEEYRTNQYYAEKLVRLFGDFRKFTIARIRPRLAQLSSDLMLEMSDGRYSLVELDEDYNLRLMDYGQYFGIDRYSGGEKDLASLCLRLSISLALTESAGLDRSFVILDEVFGSQDEQRRDLIFQALAGLKVRFPQILLVTHLEELKHKVETLIEVRPTGNGWSEVVVNGRPA